MPDCCKKPYDDIITIVFNKDMVMVTVELNTVNYLFSDIP